MNSNSSGAFNLFTIQQFLSRESCERLIAELRSSAEAPASVYSREPTAGVDQSMRRVARVEPSPETIKQVKIKLKALLHEVGSHFGIQLKDCEEPQFLRYRIGDFFVAHQDGNTGLLRLDKEQERKVSVVIFLNRTSQSREAETYCGGELVFTDWRGGSKEFRMAGEVGKLVAFPAETTHEVTPLTYGERYSVVAWYVS